jgi:hypothetical protein
MRRTQLQVSSTTQEDFDFDQSYNCELAGFWAPFFQFWVRGTSICSSTACAVGMTDGCCCGCWGVVLQQALEGAWEA